MSKSVPKLLQEANEIRKALEKIGAGMPEGLTAADMETKIEQEFLARMEMNGSPWRSSFRAESDSTISNRSGGR